jgi:acyltransferase
MSISKRIDFIDIAKGFGIILVVFGHTYRGNDLNLFIYSFHMPLFFFFSGLLFNEKKYASFRILLKNKFKTLLLPYITFYIITYLYWFFVEKYLRPGYNISFDIPLIGFFYGSDYEKYMCPNGVLWFLTSLFVTEILLYNLLRLKNNYVRILLVVFSGIIGYLISLIEMPLPPFSSGTALMALVFAATGYYSKDFILNMLSNYNRLFLLTISIVLFIVVYFLALQNGRITMVYMDYFNPILFLITAVLGIFATLLLSVSIKGNKIVQYFGINTLIFVGLSEPIKRALIGVFAKVTNMPVDDLRISIFWSFAIVITCFVLFIPIIFVFNKYLYKFIGKNKSLKTI